jgi:ABC-type Fe3+ transport system permease subunit
MILKIGGVLVAVMSYLVLAAGIAVFVASFSQPLYGALAALVVICLVAVFAFISWRRTSRSFAFHDPDIEADSRTPRRVNEAIDPADLRRRFWH